MIRTNRRKMIDLLLFIIYIEFTIIHIINTEKLFDSFKNIPNYDRMVINDWRKNKTKANGIPLYVTIHNVDTKEELPHYLFGYDLNSTFMT